MDLKKELTERIINMVDKAKELKPSEADTMIFVEGYHRSIGAFGTVNCWVSTDCIYYDVEGNRISKKEIEHKGSWQWHNPANYILYNEGLLYLIGSNIKNFKRDYDKLLDYDMIYPINNLYSDKYRCKMLCEKIIKNHKNSNVELVFILDYEFAENRKDMKFNKNEYSVKGEIICDDLKLELPHMWYTNLHILFDKVRNTLIFNSENEITIKHIMTEEDKNEFTSHTRWRDDKSFDMLKKD